MTTDPLVPRTEHDQVALVELVNRVVDKGVVLHGELTISVADVDLLYVGLRMLLCTADRLEPMGTVRIASAEAPDVPAAP